MPGHQNCTFVHQIRYFRHREAIAFTRRLSGFADRKIGNIKAETKNLDYWGLQSSFYFPELRRFGCQKV